MVDICSPGRDDSSDTSQGICLIQRFNDKNATLNQACILDNLTFYNMNRDNCIIGSFCSIGDNTCVSTFAKGQSCTEDRQCVTGACKKGICSEELEYNRIPYWIYIIIGCGAGIILVSCLLYIYLRRRKRMQRYKKTVSQHENVLREMVINLPNTEPNEHPDENSNHATTSIPQAPPQLPPPEF
ncbi:hypothetical protein K7432_007478 [Basidiobolus ranarum]|uniref:Uncharacterized protein n=1 Tax=Basidiobolus ranarum TaxID=34480 RepID=A0ABR2W0Y6_9FUNG